MTTHLYELVPERAERHPAAVALGCQQGLTWLTFDSRQVRDRVDRLAVELAERGVGEGDRVVLWLPNHAWTPLYLFAIWKRGAIAVPFDREMNADGARRIIDLVAPALVLAGYGERPAWASGDGPTEWWEPGRVGGGGGEGLTDRSGWAAAPHPDPLSEGEGTGGIPPGAGTDGRPAGPADDLLPLPLREGQGEGRAPGSSVPAPSAPRFPGSPAWRRPSEELAVISFTSGTTGLPKGCMLTHRNLLSQIEGLQAIIPVGPDARLASILPLSHVLELTVGLLYPFARGAAVHYVPSRRGPDIVRVFAEQRITHMVAVPQVLTAMAQAADKQLQERLPAPAYRAMMVAAERLPLAGRRLLFAALHRRLGGHLRLFGSGGAALPVETHHFWERLGVRVVQGYGASECSPIISGGAADGRTPPGSVGRPLPGVEVRFTAEGELLTRGPNVMRGYWKDPERTAAALADGWFHTGDLGRVDHDGTIWLLGRAKEMIVLPSGMKVWPSDIEEVLREQAAVKDAVVVGAATAAGGMTLHAYLLPAAGAAAGADPREVIAGANGRLAVHQRVATAAWWPEEDFPRTSTLKVRRHLLPQPDSAALAGGAAPLVAPMSATDGLDPVAQAIVAVAKVERVDDADTLGALGLDSLTLVELALALEEKTGVAVADADLSASLTVAEVRALVGQAPAVTADVARAQRQQYDEGGDPPLWVYGPLGRRLRRLNLPFALLYRATITETIVLGSEHLRELPPRVVLAGTHRSWPDVMVVRRGLARTPARGLVDRLVAPGAAWVTSRAGVLGLYAMLAFGLFPLRQYRDQERSLRLLARIAAEGSPVLIFPQGHHADPAAERAGDPAVTFKTGVAHIAQALDAVVVPFGLAGSERIMLPTADGFKGPQVAGVPIHLRRGPVAIAFGPALRLAPGESLAAFTQRLQAACFALARQAEAAVEE